jgi:RNA polymerase sigma factor (sigma-70 family)
VEVSSLSEAADPRVANLMPRAARRPTLVDDGFPELFTARYAQVVRTIWFIVHDQAVAEEIAQEAFTELYRDWGRLRDFDRPDLWVRRVAIRRAQREASRAGRRAALERAANAVPRVEDAVRLPDPGLVAAIRALPPKQRAIVVLFYLEDRPMHEVADLVGCSTSTGFVQLHHARKRLAAALREEADGNVD